MDDDLVRRIKCQISQGNLASLTKNTKLIIQNEAPIAKRSFSKVLNRSLQDIMRSLHGIESDMTFGELIVMFGGDFR